MLTKKHHITTRPRNARALRGALVRPLHPAASHLPATSTLEVAAKLLLVVQRPSPGAPGEGESSDRNDLSEHHHHRHCIIVARFRST